MAPEVKTAKNSKLPKLPENCFELVGKGGWPLISMWINTKLVLTTLQNLPKSWEPFIQSISGREALPTFDRLWTYCTQEELRLRNRGVEDSSKENHALALHTKKGGKFKRNFRRTFKSEKSSSNPGYQRRDVSEI
jgi:hypothetical protein